LRKCGGRGKEEIEEEDVEENEEIWADKDRWWGLAARQPIHDNLQGKTKRRKIFVHECIISEGCQSDRD
jgi:hypothetical protein